MVGGYSIDGAVFEPGYQRFCIVFRAQRRIHLGASVVGRPGQRCVLVGGSEFASALFDSAQSPLLREDQVMWCDLCRHGQAPFLGASHQFQRASGADVRHVQPTTRKGRKLYVACDHALFCCCGLTRQTESTGDPTLVQDTVLGQRRLLAVVDDRETRGGAVAKGVTHEPRVGYRRTIVAEPDGACRCEFSHVS